VTDQLDANKTLVRKFYDLAFNQQRPAAAADQYLGQSYLQHHPGVADGAAPFVEFATGFVSAFPKLRVHFKRLVAEGELVVLHSHFIRQPGDRGIAVVDIFRVSDGKLVEHWDVLQEVPEASDNSRTMF